MILGPSPMPTEREAVVALHDDCGVMRKLKRVMINEGIEKNVKKRLVFLKGSDARVVAKRERDHRKWKKALRSKLGWIMRRKDRGF